MAASHSTLRGDSIQVNALHAKIPLGETGLAAKRFVKVRWSGQLRRGSADKFVGEFTVDVLDDAGNVKSSRTATWTATKS